MSSVWSLVAHWLWTVAFCFFVAYFLLPIAYCLLSIACCLLPFATYCHLLDCARGRKRHPPVDNSGNRLKGNRLIEFKEAHAHTLPILREQRHTHFFSTSCHKCHNIHVSASTAQPPLRACMCLHGNRHICTRHEAKAIGNSQI